MTRRPPNSPLFPSTPLSRSAGALVCVDTPFPTGRICRPTSVDGRSGPSRSEEHTSELQSRPHLVCRLLLEKKKKKNKEALVKVNDALVYNNNTLHGWII